MSSEPQQRLVHRRDRGVIRRASSVYGASLEGIPLNVYVSESGANEIVRGQAAVALGRMGKDAHEAIPVLNRIVKDETEALDLRAVARASVSKILRDKDK